MLSIVLLFSQSPFFFALLLLRYPIRHYEKAAQPASLGSHSVGPGVERAIDCHVEHSAIVNRIEYAIRTGDWNKKMILLGRRVTRQFTY